MYSVDVMITKNIQQHTSTVRSGQVHSFRLHLSAPLKSSLKYGIHFLTLQRLLIYLYLYFRIRKTGFLSDRTHTHSRPPRCTASSGFKFCCFLHTGRCFGFTKIPKWIKCAVKFIFETILSFFPPKSVSTVGTKTIRKYVLVGLQNYNTCIPN